jgi:hypothetical protein
MRQRQQDRDGATIKHDIKQRSFSRYSFRNGELNSETENHTEKLRQL